jgi:hypothetical protein
MGTGLLSAYETKACSGAKGGESRTPASRACAIVDNVTPNTGRRAAGPWVVAAATRAERAGSAAAASSGGQACVGTAMGWKVV